MASSGGSGKLEAGGGRGSFPPEFSRSWRSWIRTNEVEVGEAVTKGRGVVRNKTSARPSTSTSTALTP